MVDIGLETSSGRYLDAASAQALATVNQMSLFGPHRRLRGALVGHFATVGTTSHPGSRRLAQALHKAGAGRAACDSTKSMWKRTPSMSKSCAGT